MILYKIDKETNIKYSKLVEFKLRHLPKALREIAYKPLDLIASIDEQINNARRFLNHFKSKYPLDEVNPDVLNEHIKKIIEDPEKDEAEKLVISAGLTLDDIPIKSTTEKDKISYYQRKMKELRNALHIFGVKKPDLESLGAESKRSLVLMTEGPAHNILRWASPAYNKNGSQNIMIGTDITLKKLDEVYFQIIHTMMVLENMKFISEN